MSMELNRLQHGFTYLLLERVDLEKNENRFYYESCPMRPMLHYPLTRKILDTSLRCGFGCPLSASHQ